MKRVRAITTMEPVDLHHRIHESMVSIQKLFWCVIFLCGLANDSPNNQRWEEKIPPNFFG